MVNHSKAAERAIYQALVESAEVQSISQQQISADCDGGDIFVVVGQKTSRPPQAQLALLAAVARGAINHAAGSQCLDESGKFAESPDGDSITTVVAGSDFLRLDVSNPEEWHDLSQSRLMTKAAMSMERV